MKRKRLIKELRKLAKDKGIPFELLREGGNHSIYTFGDEHIPVPRHSEINEQTAQSILREAKK